MKKIYTLFFGGLFLIFILLGICLYSFPDGKLHVRVLDIGQGDAILIETPSREYVLIDGGPDDRVIQRLSEVLPFYQKTIDVMVLTHPHADHINGLVEVLKRYTVRQVLMTGAAYHYAGYDAFLQLIAEKNIPMVFAGSGRDFRLGNVYFDVLYPFESIQNRSFENLNNSSVVFRLLHGSKKFYFGGDLEMEKEQALLESGFDLRADFLKAGHHGSKTSNTEALLDRMRPKFAAISCGVDNQFKHPSPSTIEHFQKRGLNIYRTDLDGTIEAVSDGENLSVKVSGKEG